MSASHADKKSLMLTREELMPCPFCGKQPYFALGKRGSCQLHGEPFQAVVIHCKQWDCPAKPTVSGGDIYEGGEGKAREEVAKKWNWRHRA